MEKRHINRNVFRLSNTYSFYYSLIGKLYYFLCLLNFTDLYISSVQFSCSVVSNSLRPHGLQHTKPPCPSPTPRAYSNSCPQSQWCHSAISSYVFPFSSCLQSFPASGSLQMSQFFASGEWSIRVSASVSVFPMNMQDWFPSFRMDWLDLLAVQGILKSLLQHHSSKASILRRSAFFIVQLSQSYMTNGKTIALTRQTFVGKVVSMLFNTLSRFVIAFIPRSKRLLILWLHSPSAVILEPKKIKFVTVSNDGFSLIYFTELQRKSILSNMVYWQLQLTLTRLCCVRSLCSSTYTF